METSPWNTARNHVILVAFFLACLIWLLDGVLDYFFFYQGSFLGLVLTDVPAHELYVRVSWLVGLLALGVFASRIIEGREEALEEKEELEELLRAVRNVNQLLVRSDHRGTLIQETCRKLIEARGYEHAWIVLFDENRDPATGAQEGLGGCFGEFLEGLYDDGLPRCAEKPLTQSSVVVTEDPSSCTGCPLSETYGDREALTVRMEYEGRVYGLLSASVPSHSTAGREERELFEEVAGDVAYALHKLETENALERSERRFRSYLENAPLGVFLVDERGRYLEVNEAACRLTGYSEDELLDMRVTDIYPQEEMERLIDAFEEDLLEDGQMEVELPYIRKDGSEGIMVSNSVELSENRYLGFAQDITERKRAERELEEATLGTLQALNRTIEARDEYTGEHIDRVQEFSVKTGERLGLSEERLKQLRYASILHDVGKIGVPDSILGKPGQLTEREWVEMEKHPKIGERIVGQVDQLKRAARIIGQHQERYDGTGYPEGLQGEEITLEARIIAVADAWDAMRTDRPYREALPREEAIEELKENSGSQFDPEVVEVMLELIEEGAVALPEEAGDGEV